MFRLPHPTKLLLCSCYYYALWMLFTLKLRTNPMDLILQVLTGQDESHPTKIARVPLDSSCASYISNIPYYISLLTHRSCFGCILVATMYVVGARLLPTCSPVVDDDSSLISAAKRLFIQIRRSSPALSRNNSTGTLVYHDLSMPVELDNQTQPQAVELIEQAQKLKALTSFGLEDAKHLYKTLFQEYKEKENKNRKLDELPGYHGGTSPRSAICTHGCARCVIECRNLTEFTRECIVYIRPASRTINDNVSKNLARHQSGSV